MNYNENYANKNANDCFPRRRATRTMQSVRCSLFGHAIQFNTALVHTSAVIIIRGVNRAEISGPVRKIVFRPGPARPAINVL